MSDTLVDQLALELVPGIGAKAARQLTTYCGSASEVFRAPKSQLLKIPGIGEKIANALQGDIPRSRAEQVINKCASQQTDIIHFTSKRYPSRLKLIPDSPNFLYVQGNADLNANRVVSIVGTRRSTSYGTEITEQIVEELSHLGVTTVSGLAYGIDIRVHTQSVKRQIPTIAVVAGGLDRIYPSVHRRHAADIVANGAVVTESLPGTKPDAHLFPVRNRIIAGMSEATIVVEAAERGGALITANLADSYNKPVFAVPGKVGTTYSLGTNALISQQIALIYTGVNDLIYHLGWDAQDKPDEINQPELQGNHKIIYESLMKSQAAVEIDQLAISTDLPINMVASLLLELEFQDLVKCYPGKRYGLK